MKLQIVNLASKLCLTNPEQTELLAQYVYSLARYDPSYDLRDRVRLMRHLVFPVDGPDSRLGKYARRIFMATKPAPRLESSFKGERERSIAERPGLQVGGVETARELLDSFGTVMFLNM